MIETIKTAVAGITLTRDIYDDGTAGPWVSKYKTWTIQFFTYECIRNGAGRGGCGVSLERDYQIRPRFCLYHRSSSLEDYPTLKEALAAIDEACGSSTDEA